MNANKLFTNANAWVKKAGWKNWHFYHNSTIPICGLGPNILTDDKDAWIFKAHPDFETCQDCIANGERAGLWSM